MSPPGVHAHAAEVNALVPLRPRRQRQETRQGDDQRRRCAAHRSGRFDRARRDSAAAFVRNALTATTRPYLCVRVNGLQTGLTDADLDAVAPAKPDAIMLPKAEGGASVIHAAAKLAVREAQNGLPDGFINILPTATETAAS